MVVRCFLFILFCVGLLKAEAQTYLQLKSFQRIAQHNKASFAWSGAAVDLGYRLRVARGFRNADNYTKCDIGAEMGFLEWGPQILPYLGHTIKLPASPQMYFSVSTNIYNGIILFRPKPLYQFAAEAKGGVYGTVSKNLDIGFGASVRYSLSPKYKLYSSVYSYWHFTGELVFVIHRQKRNKVKPIIPTN